MDQRVSGCVLSGRLRSPHRNAEPNLLFATVSDLSTILQVLLKVPRTPLLLRKKNLLVLAFHNRVLGTQALPRSVLDPLAEEVVDSISATVYHVGCVDAFLFPQIVSSGVLLNGLRGGSVGARARRGDEKS